MRHLTWEGSGYGDLPMSEKDRLTIEEFAKAQEVLRKAHVPGPYKAIIAP